MWWITARVMVICVISFFAYSSRIVVAQDNVYRFSSGVHLSKEHGLTDEQLRRLVDGLRFWTGLGELAIDGHGNLSLGDRSRLSGGSKTARELIIKAVDSEDSFTLARQNHSSTIAFAQIEQTDRYVDGTGRRYGGWQLRIDFADFDELRGDDKLQVFDPAINVLHELAHGVVGYFDPIDSNDPLGDCERFVNRIRSELGLPERLYYYPRYSRVVQRDGMTFLQGELRFGNGKRNEKDLVVTFNVERIFDVDKAKSKAVIQEKVLALKRAQTPQTK